MKTIKLLLIIASVLFITGCGQAAPETNTTDLTTETTEFNSVDDTQLDDSTATTETKTTSTTETLNEIEDYQEILKKEDRTVEECNSISDKRLKDRCEATIYTQMAIDELDESICKKIFLIDKKEKCLLKVEESILFSDAP